MIRASEITQGMHVKGAMGWLVVKATHTSYESGYTTLTLAGARNGRLVTNLLTVPMVNMVEAR